MKTTKDLIAVAKGAKIGSKPFSAVFRLQNNRPELIETIESTFPQVYCILDQWEPLEGNHAGRVQSQRFIELHQCGTLHQIAGMKAGGLHFVESLEAAHQVTKLFNQF